MGYDRGDSFPFDFKPNGILFGSKSKGKLPSRSYPFNVKVNGNIVFSVQTVRKSTIGRTAVRETGVMGST